MGRQAEVGDLILHGAALLGCHDKVVEQAVRLHVVWEIGASPADRLATRHQLYSDQCFLCVWTLIQLVSIDEDG